eukprot:CAMPEP_0185795660 /NCGR_PEP_ID=MMETSP1174-20130828/160661_1 /TAXON_ID=35687 /ORGANISM="Dictyocha speculum, Strain CCMP1381" /LENGTH=178 /DNA_ID=CAMNT_0028490961 /DNA_START=795 /DNA_END=1331 /DNA_ORIENTATION=-
MLVIALFTVKLYSAFDPYIDDSDDLLAEISQWNIIASLLFSIIIQTETIPAQGATSSFMVILLASIIGCFCFWYFVYATQRVMNSPSLKPRKSKRMNGNEDQISLDSLTELDDFDVLENDVSVVLMNSPAEQQNNPSQQLPTASSSSSYEYIMGYFVTKERDVTTARIDAPNALNQDF